MSSDLNYVADNLLIHYNAQSFSSGDVMLSFCIHQFLSGTMEENFLRIIDCYKTNDAAVHVFHDMALSGFPLGALSRDSVFLATHREYLQQIIDLSLTKPDFILLSALDVSRHDSYRTATMFIRRGEFHILSTRTHPYYHEMAAPSWGLFTYQNNRIAVISGKPREHIVKQLSTVENARNIVSLHNHSYGPKFLGIVNNYREYANRYNVRFINVNQLGMGEGVFYPGFSMVCDSSGTKCIGLDEGFVCGNDVTLSKDEMDYSVATLALRDYFNKGGFAGIVLGVSGGIDSALSLAIAVDAIGADNVLAINMATRFNDCTGINDAKTCCANLGVTCDSMDIDSLYVSLMSYLESNMGDLQTGTVSENLQSRIRGIIAMTYSNNHNYLLLNSGNKTELLTGYCTLYGDMCGGFSAISDLYKEDVYRLALWRNSNIPTCGRSNLLSVIPQSIIERAPSAELRPNQTDEEDLGGYNVLDIALKDITSDKQEEYEVTGPLINLKDRIINNEFKRRQTCSSVRITSRRPIWYPLVKRI